jgi:hypothetical protein
MDKLDVGEADFGSGEIRLKFLYVVDIGVLSNPDKIANISITLPTGVTARFIRSGGWQRDESMSDDNIRDYVKAVKNRDPRVVA